MGSMPGQGSQDRDQDPGYHRWCGPHVHDAADGHRCDSCAPPGHPLVGTYEVVALSLALVIGFTIPKVSLRPGSYPGGPGHRKGVQTDARPIEYLYPPGLSWLFLSSSAYNLFAVANELRASGEVSPTIQLPAYPVAYGVAVCCFIECLVFVLDIVKIWTGDYE